MSKSYVPHNVTRQANLPPTDFTLIALAPWISIECTLAYLAAARLDPARAFLFYLPDNGTDRPPPISSSVWGLGDGGAWKTQNPFPVYALPSDVGTEMMKQSSLYSGNMTSVPFGHEISELPHIDPRDYVRLYTQLSTSNSSVLPGLWAFLLIIVGVLAAMLALTSVSMHVIQRSRRQSLRRRVANGEVNLEALGIKRLTVPQDVISKLPLFMYVCENEASSPASTGSKKNSHVTTYERHTSSEGSSQEVPAPQETSIVGDSTMQISPPPHSFLPHSQPTCAICLDDFESGTTTIRELPCGHVFHPECIDSFLSNNSSLCPMCKKSILPIGYCPTNITNSMVRRERNLRRLRSTVTLDEEADQSISRNRLRDFSSGLKRMIFSTSSTSTGTPTVVPLHAQPVLMTNAILDNTHNSLLGNEVRPTPNPRLSRREIAQQRIRELAARQSFIEESDTINSRRRPKCRSFHPVLTTNTNMMLGRRTFAKVFPGFS